MLKKLVYSSMAAGSLLAATIAHAAAPGFYVNGQIGYADTHMGSKTNFASFGPSAFIPSDANNRNLSNNGLAGRIAMGYQFNQNFAIEVGYLQLGDKKVAGVTHLTSEPLSGKLKLQQHAIDLVAKEMVPINNQFNFYGKLGVAYLTTNVDGDFAIPGQTAEPNLNGYTQIARHTFAPEVALGASYDLSKNVSLDTSWTHIQTIGGKKPGNVDFFAVGLGYNFG